MVPITVPVNWRIMRLEKSLRGEIYGQFSIGAQTCQFLEPPSAKENKNGKHPKQIGLVSAILMIPTYPNPFNDPFLQVLEGFKDH